MTKRAPRRCRGAKLQERAAGWLLGLFCLAGTTQALATNFDHSPWDALLKECVTSIDAGNSTAANYRCFKRERDRLRSYLDALATVEPRIFDDWKKEDQLAFLINAYNAWTVQLILSEYPDLESIRDLGSLFRSPWERAFIPLLGKTRSLDDIEHGMIRDPDRFREPRIHFAVNCASIGCPALRKEAYSPTELERQLDEQTRQFLGDETRNRLRNGRLEVSSLFKWYRKDFESGWRGLDSLEAFLAYHASALGLSDTLAASLQRGEIPINHLDYDWRLNDLPESPGAAAGK